MGTSNNVWLTLTKGWWTSLFIYYYNLYLELMKENNEMLDSLGEYMLLAAENDRLQIFLKKVTDDGKIV